MFPDDFVWGINLNTLRDRGAIMVRSQESDLRTYFAIIQTLQKTKMRKKLLSIRSGILCDDPSSIYH